MTDFFSLLEESRQPWIEPDPLKARFLGLAAPVHPDRIHGAPAAEMEAANRRYADLNLAYNTLREPRERLLHLLELELGARPSDIQRIPTGTMDLFVEVGQTCRDVDAFLVEKQKVTSPMLKVQLFERGQEWADRLAALQQKINALRDTLFRELREMNPLWESAPPGGEARKKILPLERLEQVYRVLSYVARWTEQIQERVVPLAF